MDSCCNKCGKPMEFTYSGEGIGRVYQCVNGCWQGGDKAPQNGESMDKIVTEARKMLGGAIQALNKGDGYNTKHPYEASFPNGASDHIRMIMENIIRLDATGDFDKAVDVLGYCALYVSWLRAGAPKSEFSWISNRYMNLFKIQERQIELQSMSEHESNTNRQGTDSVSALPNG